MKLKILQENLKNSLGHLQKVIPNKPQITVLASVLIQANDNNIVLSATDLYLGVRTELVAEVEEAGSLIVNGELFKNLINSLNPGKVDIELQDNSLVISQGKTISRLTCQKSDEFPEFPTVSGDAFSITLSNLEKIQNLVAFCASPDQSRPVLTAVLFKFKQDGLEVVATDGFRLSNLVFKDVLSDLEKLVLVPAKALSELNRIAKQVEVKEVDILVSSELKQILFKLSHVKMYVRLIEGDFPPYEKIIPPSFEVQVEFDSDSFLTELKRAAIFSRDVSNIVQLNIEKDRLLISAKSVSLGDYSGEMEVVNETGKTGEIAFNVNYLIDFINATKPEFLEFCMNESLKPALFRDKKTKDYFHIAMPFRVNS